MRRCPWCHAPLVRKPGEDNRDWRQRRYCGYECSWPANAAARSARAAALLKRQAQQIPRPAAPEPPPVVAVVGYVPLRRRDGTVRAWARVDGGRDLRDVAPLRWYLGSGGYAMRQIKIRGRNSSRAEFMHRRLLGLVPGDGIEGDHVNRRDKLDNRRANLRIVTRSENEQNKASSRAASGHQNVYFDRQRQAFFARVKRNGKQHVRAYFESADDAAEAAAELRRLLHPYAPT